ncbi:DUF4880 domain-containing protein [Pseudomonas capeferrum]|uniref:DUF4880 domain-containing protein n=1 Tax=Pseudomonas capeferrum TaxID=1495066 RepID=UPI0015E385D4|nr:DUF4880 domain-containing protein [Pseudomonas capeferrum]MBA1200649.1 DUF4880 domain-containing protein [Pseudomonas capeferrum]
MVRPLPHQDSSSPDIGIQQDALLHGLSRLPRRVQQVFLLNRLDQQRFADIAKRLDLSSTCIEHCINQVLRSARPSADALADQAARWYVRLQSPEVTASERIDFRRWLDAAPQHLQAFHEIELRWRSLLAPAWQLGHDGWYRQGRAALSLSGCSVAVSLGAAVLLAIGLWV